MKKLGEKMLRLYLKLKYSEKGATAVEYGLLVALIAAVIVGTVLILGGKVNDAFQAVIDGMTGGGV
jgi:pilus assembly protein Flp/PilA